jgi:hypothetical protein
MITAATAATVAPAAPVTVGPGAPISFACTLAQARADLLDYELPGEAKTYLTSKPAAGTTRSRDKPEAPTKAPTKALAKAPTKAPTKLLVIFQLPIDDDGDDVVASPYIPSNNQSCLS